MPACNKTMIVIDKCIQNAKSYKNQSQNINVKMYLRFPRKNNDVESFLDSKLCLNMIKYNVDSYITCI